MLYQWLKRRAWIFDIGFQRMESESGKFDPGWAPQMFVFSCFALTIMAWCSLKIPLAWPCALLDVVATIITHVLLKRSAKRIYRMGWLGFTRPRWWIELSAALCTATMGLLVTAMSQVNPIAPPARMVNAFADFCGSAAVVAGWAFLLTAAVGMTLGQIFDRPVRGRAIELVAPTFWFVVLMKVIAAAPDAWTVPIVIGIAMVTVSAAFAYFYFEREPDTGMLEMARLTEASDERKT